RFVAGTAHDAVRAALLGVPPPDFVLVGPGAAGWAEAPPAASAAASLIQTRALLAGARMAPAFAPLGRVDLATASGALTVPFVLPPASDAAASAQAGHAADQQTQGWAPGSAGRGERALGPLRALGQLDSTYLVAES